jgi:hypothetical protein
MARPSSSPRGRDRIGGCLGTVSASTNVISTALIWPKSKLDRTGSVDTAGATSAIATKNRRTQAGSRVTQDQPDRRRRRAG